MLERLCACPGCPEPVEGRRSDAQYCTAKCGKRAKRLVELNLNSWPAPTPRKPLASATRCRYGHEWTSESHVIAKNGRRMCLRCRRSRMPNVCARGHAWTADNTRIGSKGQRVCVTCAHRTQAGWKKANPDKVRAEQRRRRRTANPEMGEQARMYAREWRAKNLGAALENARRWREENPERVQESYRRWCAANPESIRRRGNMRRARKAEAAVCGPVPLSVYTSVLNSGPCVYCAAPAAEVDHIRPLSRGGIEHASNLVPACKSCNSGKKDRMLDEWDQVRVARAVKASKKARVEWERIQSGQDVLF